MPMPARRDYTPEELTARLQRRRQQTREAVRRYRARRGRVLVIDTDAVSPTVSDTTAPENMVTLTSIVSSTPLPPQTPPTPVVPTEQRLLERLAPFASRAFKPDPAFLALLAERYPAVDLELELAAALDWLEEPRNAKRRCSKGFLANWVKKADADRKAREALPPPMPPANGHTWNGVYVQPNSLRHNRQPPSDDDWLPLGELLPIAREDHERTVAANRGLTLEQKRARFTARLNGHASEGGKG
jgi:hypothetical protein